MCLRLRARRLAAAFARRRYVFAGDTGDVIQTATFKVVAKIGNLLNSRKFVEIDCSKGRPVASSGRQGVGQTR